MSRLFKQGLAPLLFLTLLVACTSKSTPITELLSPPTPTPSPAGKGPEVNKPLTTAATTRPQSSSSLTVSAKGGDLDNRETQVALLSAINWKSLSDKILLPETELIVLVEGESVTEPSSLVSDPETLQTQLKDSDTGGPLTVSLIYLEGDDELLQTAISIARSLDTLGVQVRLFPIEAEKLQKFLDTHLTAGEEVLLINR